MPALSLEDRKTMLGRQTWVCKECGIYPFKDYCRQCDEFFYECNCKREKHIGHRKYARKETAAEWLIAHKKKPFKDAGAMSHYWQWVLDTQDVQPAYGYGFDLPQVFFALLQGELIYGIDGLTRAYPTEQAALEDFYQAYDVENHQNKPEWGTL